MTRLFIFGIGYAARAAALRFLQHGDVVAGTTRALAKAADLEASGIEAHIFTGVSPLVDAQTALAGTTHLLVSVQADQDGADAVLRHNAHDLAALAGDGGALERIIYLSTTAVYGDHGGAWIDEDTPVAPASRRARHRVAAEAAWQDFATQAGVELDILRLSGIYGPGRNQIVGLQKGKARRIIKAGQVFNRIHVDDIAEVIAAVAERGLPGAIYNLADDEPAAPDVVIEYAAGLCAVPLPPAEAFLTASMTPMARSFYSESKRISNDRIKARLGVCLSFPTYREGLTALAGVDA